MNCIDPARRTVRAGLATAVIALLMIALPGIASAGWTTYHSSTISANTYVYSSYQMSTGNRMSTTGTVAIAVFQVNSAGAGYNYVYGTTSVSNSFPSAISRSACWNRSAATITATCAHFL